MRRDEIRREAARLSREDIDALAFHLAHTDSLSGETVRAAVTRSLGTMHDWQRAKKLQAAIKDLMDDEIVWLSENYDDLKGKLRN